jgi:hypothetical protein
MYQPILFVKCSCTIKGDVWLHALMEEVDPDNLDRVPDNVPRPAAALIPRGKFPPDFNPKVHSQTKLFEVINGDFLFAGLEWIRSEEVTELRKGGWLRTKK